MGSGFKDKQVQQKAHHHCNDQIKRRNGFVADGFGMGGVMVDMKRLTDHLLQIKPFHKRQIQDRKDQSNVYKFFEKHRYLLKRHNLYLVNK